MEFVRRLKEDTLQPTILTNSLFQIFKLEQVKIESFKKSLIVSCTGFVYFKDLSPTPLRQHFMLVDESGEEVSSQPSSISKFSQPSSTSS